MTNRERFAARLKVLRDGLGLSLDAVGAAVGVSGETIRNYELGRSAPRSKGLVSRLEQALEARPGELWALLKGYEIPTKPGRRGAGDSDALAAIQDELREVQAVLAELERELRENGGPRGSHREASKVLAS